MCHFAPKQKWVDASSSSYMWQIYLCFKEAPFDPLTINALDNCNLPTSSVLKGILLFNCMTSFGQDPVIRLYLVTHWLLFIQFQLNGRLFAWTRALLLEVCEYNKGLYEVVTSWPSISVMWQKINKIWWYCKILLEHFGFVEMMLLPPNHM